MNQIQTTNDTIIYRSLQERQPAYQILIRKENERKVWSDTPPPVTNSQPVAQKVLKYGAK